MSEKTGTNYHHGNLREEILRVSIDILREGGIDAITMREIATRIGVSHSAAYRHFSGKDALLSAIAQQGYEELTLRLQEVYSAPDIPVGEKFRQMGVAYITYAIAHPAQYRLMYGSDALDRRANPALGKAARRLLREVFNMIHLCQQCGSLKTDSPRELSHATWSLTHGAAMLVIDGHIRPDDVHAFADRMTFHLGIGIASQDKKHETD